MPKIVDVLFSFLIGAGGAGFTLLSKKNDVDNKTSGKSLGLSGVGVGAFVINLLVNLL